jgi:hypothetical protein
MEAAIQRAERSSTQVWVGRVISGFVVLFMIFDAVGKLLKIPQVVQATTVQLGFPESTIIGIGVVLLGCTAVYVVPRTAPLGAVLLTGYLGGATAANVRVGDPLFETIFPILFALLVWLGLILRDERVRAVLRPRDVPTLS